MKIRNSLFESSQYNNTMTKIHQSHQLSVMDAYRINRLIKQINELQQEYTGLKQGLLEKFGEKIPAEEGYDPQQSPESQTAQGEMYRIEEGKQRDEFLKEMTDLINVEHDLGIDKLPFPTKIDDGISISDMDVLDIFFDFGFDTADEPPNTAE